MTKVLVIMAVFLSFSSLQGQKVKMEVAGSVVVGDSEEVSPTPGTIRWTGIDFEAFNGLKWVSLTGGKTAPAVDVDGNVYPTLKIGDQIWFLENLRTSKYADGTDIPLVTDKTQWGNLSTGAYCWYNNNNIYDAPQGKLYNRYALLNSSGLCPEGWREPTQDDFTELITYLGGAAIAGAKLKQEGTTNWEPPNDGATNSSGFNAVGYGERYDSGDFSALFPFASHTRFWSTTLAGGKYYSYGLYTTHSTMLEISSTKPKYGLSVRCIK